MLTMTVASVRLILVFCLCCPSFSFSSQSPKVPVSTNSCNRKHHHTAISSPLFGTRTLAVSSLLGLRGGDQPENTESEGAKTITSTADSQSESTRLSLSLAPMASKLASLGAAYGASLEKNPIPTKSVTAGAIFALSDWLAQRLEKNKDDKTTNWTRTISSALVGLLYFGPAAHLWYETIFKILPGTSLISTLQKAALGQLLFGPSFTCIFFATSLMQQGKFSLQNWATKIKEDLPGAWIAGLGFWPLVDLVSYSMIPKNWIPLFVNTCSLVWTIYLSIVANRQSDTTVNHKD